MIEKYTESLVMEVKKRANKLQDRNIVAVYFGGGTPSHLNAANIIKILNTVKNNYRLTKNAEITIECNPESLNEEKIIEYKSAGINRLSMGVQSLNDKTLRIIGRTHNKEKALTSINIIKKHFKNFSLDFIIGLPFQNPANFKKELDEIISFNAPHLSFYFLSPDTKAVDNFIKDCPPEDEQITIYNHLANRLKKDTYIHYEVSNYAKRGYECRHNMRYWEQKEYLGLGLSAHSYLNSRISYNTSILENYISNPNHPHETFTLDKELKQMDKIMLNLRTSKGLELTEFKLKFRQKLLSNANNYIENKYLDLKNERLYPTEKGFLILNRITEDLL